MCLWAITIVFFSHNKHRYIPLFTSAGLIHKAQAIPQDLPQDLTNLLSYVFCHFQDQTADCFIFQVQGSFQTRPVVRFSLSELTLRCLCLFSIAGNSVCISGESVCCVLGFSVTAGDALRSGAGPFAPNGQAFLEAL